MQVPIWVSNRHIHLSKADAEKLFGEWFELTKKRGNLTEGSGKNIFIQSPLFIRNYFKS